MNIYVGNLSYRLRREELEAAFAPYGEVTSARIITDRETRRSKGFGFVEMSDDEAAERAITELNEQELAGRKMVVKPAMPREDKQASAE